MRVIEEILSYLINAPAPLLAGGLTGLTTGVVAVVVLVRTVRQYVGWLEGLNGFLSEMGRYTRLEPALAAATKTAAQLNGASVALVYLQDTPESALVLKSAWPQDFGSYVPAYVDEPAWSRPPVHRAHTFCPCSLALLGIAEAPSRRDAAVVIAPISAGPRVQGYLVLVWDKPRVPTTAPQTCISVGEHLGVLVDNFWMYEALRAQAVASDTTVADLQHRETARLGLVRGVLHDLRNPLQLVRGFLATSIRDPQIPEEVTRDLRIAQGAAARAIDLAETLLLADVPERYQPQIEPVDVASVIKNVVAQAVPAAEAAKVTLQANIPPDLPAAQADHQALYRILDNLVLNAMRHTAGGGKVTIQPDYQDGKVIVQVSDTGRGMSDDALQTLLHGPLEEAPQGGRLGVWIVRRLVAGMGGELEGSSRPGGGLSLRFTLPAAIGIGDEVSCQEVLDE